MGVSLLNALVPRLAAAAGGGDGWHPVRAIKDRVKQGRVNRIRAEIHQERLAYETANGLVPTQPAAGPARK
jgi:hypothetical protein